MNVESNTSKQMKKSIKQRIAILIILQSIGGVVLYAMWGNPGIWTEAQRFVATVWVSVICVGSFTDFKK